MPKALRLFHACQAGLVSTLLSVGSVQAQEQACTNPDTSRGFKTCADIAAAIKEGQFVLYSSGVEGKSLDLLATFHAVFPEIKTGMVRIQGGGLYAKILAEMQAKAVSADGFDNPDVALARDLQNRGGYERYISPEASVYDAKYQSQPEGYYVWEGIELDGIVYNPNIVAPADAPKSWADLLDPKWKGTISVKQSSSGQQYANWYMLKGLDGGNYWSDFTKQMPHAFDSSDQMYDRIINGQDKINATGTYSEYLAYKSKGAPLTMVLPTEGMPSNGMVWGILHGAPHPNAAKLYTDWFLSPLGQKANVEFQKHLSASPSAPLPENFAPLSELHPLVPTDWDDFTKQRNQFVKEWAVVTGHP